MSRGSSEGLQHRLAYWPKEQGLHAASRCYVGDGADSRFDKQMLDLLPYGLCSTSGTRTSEVWVRFSESAVP